MNKAGAATAAAADSTCAAAVAAERKPPPSSSTALGGGGPANSNGAAILQQQQQQQRSALELAKQQQQQIIQQQQQQHKAPEAQGGGGVGAPPAAGTTAALSRDNLNSFNAAANNFPLALGMMNGATAAAAATPLAGTAAPAALTPAAAWQAIMQQALAGGNLNFQQQPQPPQQQPPAQAQQQAHGSASMGAAASNQQHQQQHQQIPPSIQLPSNVLPMALQSFFAGVPAPIAVASTGQSLQLSGGPSGSSSLLSANMNNSNNNNNNSTGIPSAIMGGRGGGGGGAGGVGKRKAGRISGGGSSQDRNGRGTFSMMDPSVVSSSTSTSNFFDVGLPPVEKDEADLKKMTPAERRRYERNLREQQRSYRISQQIKELRDVLAESNVPFKPNKFSILLNVAEYIKQLQKRAIMLDAEHRKLVDTINQTSTMTSSGQVPIPSDDVSSERDGSTCSLSGVDNVNSEQDLLLVQDINYRDVFEHCPFAIGVASLDGRILGCNDALERLFGVGQNEMNQQSLFLFIRNHQELFEAMADLLKRSSLSTEATGEGTDISDSTDPFFYWCGRIVSHQSRTVSCVLVLVVFCSALSCDIFSSLTFLRIHPLAPCPFPRSFSSNSILR